MQEGTPAKQGRWPLPGPRLIFFNARTVPITAAGSSGWGSPTQLTPPYAPAGSRPTSVASPLSFPTGMDLEIHLLHEALQTFVTFVLSILRLAVVQTLTN